MLQLDNIQLKQFIRKNLLKEIYVSIIDRDEYYLVDVSIKKKSGYRTPVHIFNDISKGIY